MNLKLKVVGLVAAFTLAIGVAAPASAATTSELINLLVSLGIISADQVGVVNAAIGGSSSSSCSLNTAPDMTVGAQGANVTELQMFLVDGGYLTMPAGVSYGYFGSLTQSALASYQAAMGISPAVGYFGPITRSSITCSTTGDEDMDDSSSSDLQGGAGDITLTARSTYSGEEVGEGNDDVPVLSVDVEADNGSDVELTSIKVEFYQATAADSRKLDRYASEVSVWLDGEKVGEADVDGFSESSNYYSESINLDGAIIDAGDEQDLVIKISALNNLDSGDIDTDAWQVDIISIRFEDASGAVLSESVDTAKTAGAGTYGKLFDFATFATANDAELKVSLEDDEINDANILDVDDNQDTEHSILSFTLDASGDSDVYVDEIPVVITVGGAPSDESVIIISADLYNADDMSNSLSSKDVPNGGVVTFDDLDLWIDAGDEVEFVVEVKVQDVDGVLTDGDTVQATVTVASIDAEDESGESLTATGSAAADTHTMYDKAIQVEIGDKTAVKGDAVASTNDTGTYTIELLITAFGDDMYIFDTASTTAATSNTKFTVSNSSTATAVSGTFARTDSKSSVNGTAGYKIPQGNTAGFTLTVAATATTTSAFHNVQLDSVAWTASSTASTGTAYSADLGSNVKTGDLQLLVR